MTRLVGKPGQVPGDAMRQYSDFRCMKLCGNSALRARPLQISSTMLKIFATILLAAPLAACAIDDPAAPEDPTDSTFDPAADFGGGGHGPSTLPALGADQEYSFFNGRTFTFSFPGF